MISCHAVSLIFELRALRSRLDQSVAQGALYSTDAEWMLALVTHMIGKVERTDAYIQDLEAVNEALVAGAEARVGQDLPGGPDGTDGYRPRHARSDPGWAH